MDTWKQLLLYYRNDKIKLSYLFDVEKIKYILREYSYEDFSCDMTWLSTNASIFIYFK